MNRSVVFVWILVGVLAFAGLGLSIKFWPWMMGQESPGTAIRNIAVVLAGLIAIPLALWRGMVAERQADVAQQGLLYDRYQRAQKISAAHCCRFGWAASTHLGALGGSIPTAPRLGSAPTLRLRSPLDHGRGCPGSGHSGEEVPAPSRGCPGAERSHPCMPG